jgi:type II secretory pathway component PulM
MKHEVEEKQKLDAQIKSLAKEVRTLRKQGDTTSAVAAERRLNGLIENQRFLKDALDQSSRDCSPILKDAEPPLDPAVRERLRLEGK